MTTFLTMSCRLCTNICKDYRSLYDDSGLRNEVYGLAEKYFAPLFLDMEYRNDHLAAVICMECWQHISEFDTFQQTVFRAQKQIQTEVVVKSEVEDDFSSTFPTKSKATADNEELSGEIAHDDYYATYASTSRFSHDPGIAEQQSAAIIKEEVEFMEYIVTEVSPNAKYLTDEKAAASTFCQDRESEYQRQQLDCGEFDSASEGSGGNFTSDDGNYSAECSTTSGQARSQEKSGNPAQQVQHKREYKKRKRITYLNTKRPQTVQEYDDLIAQWRPNLECVICSVSSSSFSLLQQHFDKQHPHEKCHIMCCQDKFYHRYEIEEHIHFHNEPSGFKCEQCYKCFARRKYLMTHKRMIHARKPQANGLKCPKCSKNFTLKKLLTTHLKYCCDTDNKLATTTAIQISPEGHNCEECGKVYKTLAGLQKHMRQAHLGGSCKAVTLKCTICDKVFNDRQNLRNHMDSHAGKQHTCPFCPATFLQRRTFYGHLSRWHRTEWTEKKKENAKLKRKKLFECSTCATVYHTVEESRRHMARHDGKPMYACPLCPATFLGRIVLYSHLQKLHRKEWLDKDVVKLELGREIYKCVSCEESFDTRLAWGEHQAMHYKQ